MRYTSDLNPSGTKDFGTHNQSPRGKGGGGRVEIDHPKYLKNDKCYKPETLGGVRAVHQGLKKS